MASTLVLMAFNTALGSIALTALTEGFQNTAVGRRALEFLTAGNNNVAVGGVPAMASPRAVAIPLSAPKPAPLHRVPGRIIILFFSASRGDSNATNPDGRCYIGHIREVTSRNRVTR